MEQTPNTSLTKTPWDEEVLKKFEQVLEQIPAPIRGIAETRVSKKAEALTLDDGRSEITEQDMVGAFFAETPGGFQGPMKASMEELGIEYTKYGFQ